MMTEWIRKILEFVELIKNYQLEVYFLLKNINNNRLCVIFTPS